MPSLARRDPHSTWWITSGFPRPKRVGVSISYGIASATLRASVRPVRAGLAEPMVGNNARSATYALLTWWNRPFSSVTELPGAPIHNVPDS